MYCEMVYKLLMGRPGWMKKVGATRTYHTSVKINSIQFINKDSTQAIYLPKATANMSFDHGKASII